MTHNSKVKQALPPNQNEEQQDYTSFLDAGVGRYVPVMLWLEQCLYWCRGAALAFVSVRERLTDANVLSLASDPLQRRTRLLTYVFVRGTLFVVRISQRVRRGSRTRMLTRHA